MPGDTIDDAAARVPAEAAEAEAPALVDSAELLSTLPPPQMDLLPAFFPCLLLLHEYLREACYRLRSHGF